VPWGSGTLSGSVFPAARRAVVAVQVRTRKGWRTVQRVRTRADGSYTARVTATGTFRVVYSGVVSPTVTIG
jgi:hypothetical protein